MKVWDASGPPGGGSLKLTWGWNGVEHGDKGHENPDTPGATSVEAIKTDLKKVAVAYQNVIVKIFDIETGKELSRLESDMNYGAHVSDFTRVPAYACFIDGTPATQINRIASITAREDKFIRIFDLTTGDPSPYHYWRVMLTTG